MVTGIVCGNTKPRFSWLDGSIVTGNTWIGLRLLKNSPRSLPRDAGDKKND
jgi:hypothetical protein